MKIYVMKIQNKFRTAGLFALALVFSLFILSCQRASKKTGEKMMEKALENATGGKANVDINGEKTVIETSAGKMEVDSKANSWPGEIPGDVPEFKFGKVTAVTTSDMDGNKAWNIVYSEVEEGFLDKYDALLKEKGFETVTMKMGEKGGSITAESQKYNVFLMGGEGNMSLAVSIKKQE
jgi:hypothetical protein